MPICIYCKRDVSNLYAHHVKCKMKHIVKRLPNTEKRAAFEIISSRNAIRQKVNIHNTTASLLQDTHRAQQSIASDQLHAMPSIRQQANNIRAVSHDQPTNYSNNTVYDNPPEQNNDSGVDWRGKCHEHEYHASNLSDCSVTENQDTDTFKESALEVNKSDQIPSSEESDMAFLAKVIKYIDPDADDPFDPDSVDETSMKFVKPINCGGTYNPPNHILAQIDLLRLLSRSGCSLNMFDKIMKWVQHYSKKQSKGNIWTEYPFESRKTFINKLAKEMKTERHKPKIRDIVFDYDQRIASIPTFSFVDETMSLLDNPTVMTTSNIIDDYDIFSGKCGEDFWIPESINSTVANKLPTPVDPHRKIGDIHTSYLHQQAVSRFCTKPHHMPVPLIFMTKLILIQRAD